LAGKPFAALSAIVTRDFYGDVNVYLFATRRACAAVSIDDGPFLWISIDTDGRALAAGKAVAATSGVRVAANIARGRRLVAIAGEVSVTFTRLDPRIGSVWNGAIQIGSPSVSAPASAFAGSFAARWCGQV
jgi:hypothetical protein